MASLDLEEIFKCKDLTSSSVDVYKTRLKKLNDNKPIKNLNFLMDKETVSNKVKDLKPNTQRNYYIAICSILKCMITNKRANKKLIKIYEDYSKILDDYNIKLKDQTAKTESEEKNWMSNEEVNQIYEDLKKNHEGSQDAFQRFLVLSLYVLNPPRRNKDYALMKVVSVYNDKLSKEFNYLDLKNKKFVFNNYKTAKKYNEQMVGVPEDLMVIINGYLKKYKVKTNEYLLMNLKTGEPLLRNNDMTLFLNRIFKKKVGSSMLRKLYLTDKYGGKIDQLETDAKMMGTSTGTIQTNYVKK